MSVRATDPKLARFAPRKGAPAARPRRSLAWLWWLLGLAVFASGIGAGAWYFVPGVQQAVLRQVAAVPVVGPLLLPREASGGAQNRPPNGAPGQAPAAGAGGEPGAVPAGQGGVRPAGQDAAAEEEARLAEVKRQLDLREQQLKEQEAKLAEREKALGARAADWDRLAAIYRAMKPAEAANILTELDDDTVLGILQRLEESQAAKILAAFDVTRAARLTEALAPRASPPTGG